MKLAHQIMLASAITVAAAAAPRWARAAEHVVEMRNQDDSGQRMAFEPGFLKVAVGDTVKFVPKDKGHNAESVAEVWPQGTEPVKGKMSSEVVFTATADGIFVFKCAPHYGMGMVAAIQVGKPTNLAAVKEYKAMGLSQKRLEKALTNVSE